MLRLANLALVILLLFSTRCFPDDKVVMEAKVDKNKVETGEIFTYTLKIEGDFSSPKLALPDFRDFKIVSQNQTKSYSFKDNKARLQFNLIYHLVVAHPGTFTIKEAILEDKERKFKSNSIVVEVSGKPLEDKKKLAPYIEQGTDI
jgi:hypothetical protein